MKTLSEDCSFKKLAHNVSEAVVLTDADGCIVWTNPAFETLCGYSLEESLGRKPQDFLQGKKTDQNTVLSLSEAVRNGKGIEIDIVNYHKNGAPYWASISITPIRGDNDALEGFIWIERDSTKNHIQVESLEEQVLHIYNALLLSEAAQKQPSAADNN
jgi:PAS domain S-box-containing protein